MENEPITQEDITTSEDLEEVVLEHGDRLDEVVGSLEAVSGGGDAIALNEESIRPLSEREEYLVESFKKLNQRATNTTTYAILDNVAVEGITDITSTVVKKALKVFSDEIPLQFKITAKALQHYANMADKVKQRLLELRPLLKERDFPLTDVFDYGAYSRFFVVNNQPFDQFSIFQEVMELENRAMQHVMRASESYAGPVIDKLLTGINALRAHEEPDLGSLIAIQDSISRHWEYTWKDAVLTPKHGQVPQIAINQFPERRFTSLAPLLDNRFLAAYEPRVRKQKTYQDVLSTTSNFGVSLVLEKTPVTSYKKAMNMPNCDELLTLVDSVCTVLGDLRGLNELAKRNDRYAKEFKVVSDIMSKELKYNLSREHYEFLTSYFKLAVSVSHVIQEPYVRMSWAYIRAALVVTSMVEQSVLVDEVARRATSKYFTKQVELYGNPALESYESTTRILKRLQSSN